MRTETDPVSETLCFLLSRVPNYAKNSKNSVILSFKHLNLTVQICGSQNGLKDGKGRAIAEAVTRWLPTAAARVRARVWQVGFVVDEVTSGQVFSEYFGFPCQKPFIPTNLSIITITHIREK
jgi:hypothetical protein